MTTPTGTIAMTDIQSEFGGSIPIGMNEYYAGGSYVSGAVAGVPTSGAISMNDLRGKTATTFGTLSPSVGSVGQGGSVTFTLSGGTGIADGTYYWRLEGTGITASDFSPASLTGSFTITSNTGSFTITTVNDATIEGAESFRALVSGTIGVPVSAVTSAYVNITETQTYSIVVDTTSIVEGGVVRFTVNTTNVADGTTLYYRISGTDIVVGDFSDFLLDGTLTVNSSTCFVDKTARVDASGEASESFMMSVYSDSGRTVLVGSSVYVAIKGEVNTLALNKSGGTTPRSTVTLTLQITSLGASAFPRNFRAWYDVGSGYIDTGINLTVAAGATSSANTTVYGPTTSLDTAYSVTYKVTCADHVDKVSNTLTGVYL